MWCIGTVTGEYLANMEDVLDLYAQPAHADVVRICFDERPSQLLDQVLTPIPAKPGVSQKNTSSTSARAFAMLYWSIIQTLDSDTSR